VKIRFKTKGGSETFSEQDFEAVPGPGDVVALPTGDYQVSATSPRRWEMFLPPGCVKPRWAVVVELEPGNRAGKVEKK
jgi:hypothetical protein